jgi:hypothetical protein
VVDDAAEWHELEGARVPVYSVARTLVDLFRQRNKRKRCTGGHYPSGHR